ncbi:8-oxo-dGTP pyrophosphatase MutT (NUDIX family) [Branchiibius hedensis]|uniref:8-oxo-dGTP pyrophosphatase MutT, NUDIX family n=1 Tax=Branchiibius hedensis TaxID=672460 RepID=A0A2Y9A0J9_9MICO|nr:NUDIX hydrolase [Branchiibius hedensis]PWJ26886.1 8-oxo-dGTP pyrophosphatase MutT (NUDIX family) [Branchiibius hedensis]SSA35697.1 8-oxo-dGTP pyrophosphatase MutT, NUDIX family [Branchiibius hedensis]
MSDAWQQLSTRIVYDNNWIRVVEDEVIRPDGSPGIYGVVELQHPAVSVVAMTDDDDVLLVEMDRYTVGKTLEVVAGGTDGQAPEVAAARELLEETGVVARTWQRVGEFNSLNGVCRAWTTVFLATDLTNPPQEISDHQLGEGISAVLRVPWPAVMRLIGDGTITDSESQSSLMLAAVALGRVG